MQRSTSMHPGKLTRQPSATLQGPYADTINRFLPDILRAAELPDWVLSGRPLSGGRINVTYKLTLGIDTRDVVLRVREATDQNYANGFAAERFVYPLIADKHIRVPHLIHHSARDVVAPFEWAIFEYIEGPDLAQLSPRPDLYNELGSMVGRLHRIRGPGFGDHTSVQLPVHAGAEFLHRLFAREVPRFEAQWPRIGADVRRFFECHIPQSFDCGYPVLLHGDLTSLNVKVQKDRLYILDWENSRWRQPGFDLPKMRLFCSKSSPECWNAFATGYRAHCETPACDDNNILPFLIYFHMRQANFEHDHPTKDHRFWPDTDEHLLEIDAQLLAFKRGFPVSH